MPEGITELPFEFPLTPLPGQQLYETYHGVYVNIQYGEEKKGRRRQEKKNYKANWFALIWSDGLFIRYSLKCNMPRPMLAKNLEKTIEFIVHNITKVCGKSFFSSSYLIIPSRTILKLSGFLSLWHQNLLRMSKRYLTTNSMYMGAIFLISDILRSD